MNRDELKSRLENLPKPAADYIWAVINKMGYHLKVRCEVKAELIDHFEDELKDCKNDEERKAKAKQIIESFGDVKLLGILLRRAKKRCRPLWRTVTARFFQAVSLLIIFLILYIVWFLTGTPAVTTDYLAELNRIARPTADESENAAPYYSKAVELLNERPEDIKELEIKDFNELTEAEKQLWAQWLENGKQVFDLVEQGNEKKYYWKAYECNDPNSGLMAIYFTNLSDYRTVVMDLIMRSRLSAENGKFEDSFHDLITCYRFGGHLKGNFTLIEQLVGVGSEALSDKAVKDILSEYDVDAALLGKFRNELETIISTEDFTFYFGAEKLMIYDMVQRVFTDDLIGGGHINVNSVKMFRIIMGEPPDGLYSILTDYEALVWIPHILFTHPGKDQTLIMADRFYNYIEEAIVKSPAQLNRDGIDIDTESMKIIKGNFLLEMLSPAVNMIHKISWRRKAGLYATVTIIALLQYNRETGEFPESLYELKEAGFVTEIPIDPWSDEPLVYKKTEEDFILYSVSENFIDDGGVVGWDYYGDVKAWADNGDQVFWPIEKDD